MTLTEFLLARIGEDEEVASLVLMQEVDTSGPVPRIRERAIRERVLAECEAKRRIVGAAEEATSLDMTVDHDCRIGARDEKEEPFVGDVILLALASVYADHPNYDEAWRASP